jgi:hypothetical protein
MFYKNLIKSALVIFLFCFSLLGLLFTIKGEESLVIRANTCPPSSCGADGYLCAGDCDCNWDVMRGVRWHYKCENGNVVAYNEFDSSCDSACGDQSTPAPGDCTPRKTYSGATTPGYDCAEGSNASVTVTACIPEGCPTNGASVTYGLAIAHCAGEGWANCGGACGEAEQPRTLNIPSGQRCASATHSCSPPDACGTCQVDIDGYGVRRWQDSGCAVPPTSTPKPPEPTATPIPTEPTDVPPPAPQCNSISMYVDNQQLAPNQLGSIEPGEVVRFKCGANNFMPTTDYYEFKIFDGQDPNPWKTITAESNDPEFSQEYQLSENLFGNYLAQCRVCREGQCQEWEVLPSDVSPPKTIKATPTPTLPPGDINLCAPPECGVREFECIATETLECLRDSEGECSWQCVPIGYETM